MSIRSTHTYAVLEISPRAYAEIRGKLKEAGYSHQFGKDDGAEVIDMHGIAVKAETERAVTIKDLAAAARSKF